MRNRGRGECADDIHLDRLVPRASGGSYTIENCVIMCSKHNMEKHAKPLTEYLKEPRHASMRSM